MEIEPYYWPMKDYKWLTFKQDDIEWNSDSQGLTDSFCDKLRRETPSDSVKFLSKNVNFENSWISQSEDGLFIIEPESIDLPVIMSEYDAT